MVAGGGLINPFLDTGVMVYLSKWELGLDGSWAGTRDAAHYASSAHTTAASWCRAGRAKDTRHPPFINDKPSEISYVTGNGEPESIGSAGVEADIDQRRSVRRAVKNNECRQDDV
ncbi:hypothetical protein SKAU_G00103500 [Synaphobranchus kaupii]|uniref:Uncharacterized protein n=1 Tax=Synaphobranchus kaupii TaxID=118154 RepID=A0A9Q1J6L3_SYNKA|nr:hypothetical protein SKAU_G00103500 [Synaphobranchus kaupii]